MKLHIGTGNTYLPGWINLDIFSFVKADIYSNAMSLPYERETFDLIYASHVLEHFNRHTILSVLGHWRDLLQFDGVLRLAVPNFRAICEFYMQTGSLEAITGLMYGGQRHFLDVHYIVFDKETLSLCLHNVGFRVVREWDWKTTDEHKYHDDYSQAYLPHMDKEKGLLMSLNMEAVK
jgi:predicted SAM-dependent methyltransferase